MERTGTSFEMKPDTFTLENMFSMELHKYSTVIGDIVTSAVKEIGIEKVHFQLFFANLCHYSKIGILLILLIKSCRCSKFNI